MENFLKIDKRVYPSIRDLGVLLSKYIVEAHPAHLIPVALKVKACPKNLILNPMMHGNFAKIYLHSSYSAPFSLVFSLALLLYVQSQSFLMYVLCTTATVLCLCILLATSFFSSVYYEQPSNAFTSHKQRPKLLKMDPIERLQYPLPEEELLREIQKVRRNTYRFDNIIHLPK